MAVEVRSFAPTIPAGTPASDGWSADMSFPARVVEGVDIRVPPGPRGEVGFYIGQAGVSVIPANPGEWIVTDNEVIRWDLMNQPTSGSWALYAYNNGLRAHTIYVRFRLGLVNPTRPGGGLAIIQPSQLQSTT